MTALCGVPTTVTTVSEAVARAGHQPYEYARRELVEPDWRRFSGWRDVTETEWRDAQWQRAHCVKNIAQLHAVVGDLLTESFYDDLTADQTRLATMSMLLPPQMLNTMCPGTPAPHTADGDGGPQTFTDAFYADPIRRYMIPVYSDREPLQPSHPYACRCSPSSSRPARSIAATARGWTWSATPHRR